MTYTKGLSEGESETTVQTFLQLHFNGELPQFLHIAL